VTQLESEVERLEGTLNSAVNESKEISARDSEIIKKFSETDRLLREQVTQLESEVERLKGSLNSAVNESKEISSRDSEIIKKLYAEVSEYNTLSLAAAREHEATLEELVRLRASKEKTDEEFRARISVLTQANEAVNQLLKASQENCSRIKDKFRKKLRHHKARASRYLQQLSWVPWLREEAWTLGFWWGFENLRTIVLNPTRFRVDIATVALNTLGVPITAIDDYLQIGVDRMPDAGCSFEQPI
jgi:chromosome segregation ATPase